MNGTFALIQGKKNVTLRRDEATLLDNSITEQSGLIPSKGNGLLALNKRKGAVRALVNQYKLTAAIFYSRVRAGYALVIDDNIIVRLASKCDTGAILINLDGHALKFQLH